MFGQTTQWYAYAVRMGVIGCYADDTTYTCSRSDKSSITDKYKLMSEFLVSNKF